MMTAASPCFRAEANCKSAIDLGPSRFAFILRVATLEGSLTADRPPPKIQGSSNGCEIVSTVQRRYTDRWHPVAGPILFAIALSSAESPRNRVDDSRFLCGWKVTATPPVCAELYTDERGVHVSPWRTVERRLITVRLLYSILVWSRLFAT